MRRIPGAALLAVLCACGSTTSSPSQGDPGRPPGPTAADAPTEAPAAACVPQTCADMPSMCGDVPDGCGGRLSCAPCATTPTPCTPTTCAAAQKNCGTMDDGCGGTQNCGECAAGTSCGGSGQPNICGAGTCQPKTCAELGRSCGAVSDGCASTLNCGSCTAGSFCGANGQCAQPAPMACAQFQAGSALPYNLEYDLDRFDKGLASTTSPCDTKSRAHSVVAWTAPKTGRFVIDTARTAGDTVLSVRAGGCDGAVLACNEDGISYGGASMVTVNLTAGQQIAIAIGEGTGLVNSPRNAHLHIRELATTETAESCLDDADNDADSRVDCADSDCAGTIACAPASCASLNAGSVVPFFATVVIGGRNDFQLSCGADRGFGADVGVRFTAPTAGDYMFFVDPGDFNVGTSPVAAAVLTACRSAEKVCEAPVSTAAVRATLAAGETALFVVEGQSGYSVSIDRWVPSESGLLCEDRLDNDDDGNRDGFDPDCQGQ